MNEKCKICGDELLSEQEMSRGVCNNCDTTLMHDKFEGGELF